MPSTATPTAFHSFWGFHSYSPKETVAGQSDRTGRVKWVSEAEVAALIDMRAAIEAVERGLAAEARGEATNMLKTHAAWNGSTLQAIGAVFPKAGIVGTNSSGSSAGSPADSQDSSV